MKLMRFVGGIGVLVSSAVLSLACGGTFCDEYPEACGPVGGGVSTMPFDAAVVLLDAGGEVIPGVQVLVSDLGGKIVEQRFTGPDEALSLTVPGDSYISVFYEDAYAFTALAAPDSPTLRFQLPPKSSNPKTEIQVTGTCITNCNATKLSVSCRAPIEMVEDGTNMHALLSDYVGCDSSAGYDAYLVGYDTSGLAVKASVASSETISTALSMPTMYAVESGQRADFSMTIDGSFGAEAVSRTVRVPYGDRPGYGFSEARTDTDDTVYFSLVTEFVPRAQAIFVVSLSDERSLLRQQLLDPVPAEVAFLSPDLAIPERPGPLQQGDPTKPRAHYVLREGRLADAVQLTVDQDAVRWVVSIPPDDQDKFSFPELPAELSSYLLDDPDDYDVVHLDLDDAEGYAAFAREPILDYAADSGTADLTIARSSR